MAIEAVRAYFSKFGLVDRILEFETSSATVELAAEAAGVIPARIAKTLTFAKDEGCVLVVMAGDARIDNGKFKDQFGMKAKMLKPEEVLNLTGHAVGGVCPFGLANRLPVYIDQSVNRFTTVFPACGSSNSAIELTPEDLFAYSGADGWVDIGKIG